ncbi:unnamed protein product [Leuciscus chuanchicus]
MYDTKSYAYRDRTKKEIAWRKISEEVGLPEETVRRKWKGLRDTYVKEKKKETEKKSGSGANQEKSWKYSAVLSFLDPFVTPRETSSNMGRGVEENRTAVEPGRSQQVHNRDAGDTAGPSERDIEATVEENGAGFTGVSEISPVRFPSLARRVPKPSPCIKLWDILLDSGCLIPVEAGLQKCSFDVLNQCSLGEWQVLERLGTIREKVMSSFIYTAGTTALAVHDELM